MILDLLQDAGISPRKVGAKEYAGPCPWCGGTDRFRVWPTEGADGLGRYFCRAGDCRKTGDVIQFLRDYSGLSFKEAAEKTGRQLSDAPQPTTPRVKCPQGVTGPTIQGREASATPQELWQSRAQALVDYARTQLHEVHRDRLALLEARGISPEWADAFRLGWNPKDAWRPRPSWGLPKQMKDNGKPRMLWIPEGLVIPYQKHRVRIRRPEGEPRYYVLPGSSDETFVASTGADPLAVVVVESELDAIALASAVGDLAAVIGLGSSAVRPTGQAAELVNRARVILMCLDADDAGQKAVATWRASWPNVLSTTPPKGKDPGEAFGLGVDLREWILGALPPRWNLPETIRREPKEREAGAQPEQKDGGAALSVVLGYLRRVRGLTIDKRKDIKGRPGVVIREPKGWSQDRPQEAAEFSRLVFRPEVLAWIDAQPTSVIRG